MKAAQPTKHYKDFQLKRTVPLKEIHCSLEEWEHEPSGARILYIGNEDAENVFCLSFQTTPDRSDGVAHILEHTVLCGSEKYPVKDPFFTMTRRSMNTFMNAFTGADFTCYPAASQIPKDFYNLLDVYLDAVFKPHLKKQSFLQEGHRLEFSTPSDLDSPLEFKGIVFNEMKGSLANPDTRVHEALDEALYPDVTYGINSGGDPKAIPSLTHQALVEFHRKYYHPGHCLFFFYGNIPIEKHLDFIEERVLRGVKKPEPLPTIPVQKKHGAKVHKTISYPSAEGESENRKALISFAWLTCPILDQETVLALSVLCTVLLSTDASPVKKALLRSGFCQQVSAYMVDEYSEIPIYINLKGCNAEDADALEHLLFDTLEKVASTGIPLDLIENALHQIEFHRSEITGDSYPYGLNLFMRAGLLAQHGGNPEDALLIHSLSKKLRHLAKTNPAYYTDLVRNYFLENTHFVRVVANPDASLEQQENTQMRSVLDAIRAQLTPEKEKQIVHQAEALLRFQEEQEDCDVDILPKIHLEDVPKESVEYALKTESMGPLTLFHHDTFTNDVLYIDLVFPIPRIEEEELSLLRLTTLLAPQMGCGGRSYDQNLEYMQAHTGGVGISEALNTQVSDFRILDPYLMIHGKCLGRKKQELCHLIRDLALSVDFSDQARVKELLLKHRTALQNGLAPNALKYAINLAASGLSMGSRIGLSWSGLNYYHYIRDLTDQLDQNLPKLIEQMEKMLKRLFCLENAHLVVTCDQEAYKQLKEQRFYGIADLPLKSYIPWENHYQIEPVETQGRIIASPVAFTAQVFQTVPYTHPDSPALCIAGNLIDNLVLHPRIREQGGAYGTGASNYSLAGNFCLYAYRDPHIARSLYTFEDAAKIILEGNFEESDLEEAKLEILQDLDTPTSPGSRGHLAYTRLREGKTAECRQTYRTRLLALTREEVIAAVEKHIFPGLKRANTVVFAGKGLLEKENDFLEKEGKTPLKLLKI